MKRLLILAFVLAGLNVASATPLCVTGTLASYIALGSGGCTIGSDTLASFTALTVSFGATAINASSVTITPSGGSFNPELMFTLSQTASTNQTYESFFTYDISGPPYVGDAITLSGSSETGNGDVTDTQTYCAGGHFGPDGVDGCTGTTNSLIAIDGAVQSASTTLAKQTSIAVTDDFVIHSGGQGSASGGVFSDQFAAVPEPGVFFLTGTGLVFALLRKRQSHHVNSKL